MSRLATEVDIVVSAVYRYYPSKGALIAELQREALVRLSLSLSSISARADAEFESRELRPVEASATRLVLFGRWFCAASIEFSEEVRLLHQIMSHRQTVLDPEGGARMMPVAMDLLLHAVHALEEAVQHGALRPGSSIDRAAIWASALGGVLEADDLEPYLPDVFGQTRLANQASLDLLSAWGLPPELVDSAVALVDQLASTGPLAPHPNTGEAAPPSST